MLARTASSFARPSCSVSAAAARSVASRACFSAASALRRARCMASETPAIITPLSRKIVIANQSEGCAKANPAGSIQK
jgi:hypothetical protein